VDCERVDGVDGVEPGRADLDEPALALEDGSLAAAAGATMTPVSPLKRRRL
jgi:hypothetical protein